MATFWATFNCNIWSHCLQHWPLGSRFLIIQHHCMLLLLLLCRNKISLATDLARLSK